MATCEGVERQFATRSQTAVSEITSSETANKMALQIDTIALSPASTPSSTFRRL